LIAWFRENKRDLPWRRTHDPYAIWISEVMLQQTQVKMVIPYWERWMRELPTVAKLAKANPDRVLKLWEGLGYYSRARNLQKAAQLIIANHGGDFPREFERILDLPGIGRYTAGAIASIAFGLPTPIVDGNVARVLTRYLGIRGDPQDRQTNAALWDTAEKVVKAAHDANACGDLNEALMELGATVCVPKQSACGKCPVRSRCFAFKNDKVHELPEVAARAPSKVRIFRAALIHRQDGVWMRCRPTGVVNAGFWELPNVEAFGESPHDTFLAMFPGENIQLRRLCDVKHTITRYRMVLEVFDRFSNPPSGCKFLCKKDLNRLPLVNAHRKVLLRIGLIEGPTTQRAKVPMEKLRS
jgi:A/G-specific adenine glycosylase